MKACWLEVLVAAFEMDLEENTLYTLDASSESV